MRFDMRKNIFACLLSTRNTISLHVMNNYVEVGYVSRDTSPIIRSIPRSPLKLSPFSKRSPFKHSCS